MSQEYESELEVKSIMVHFEDDVVGKNIRNILIALDLLKIKFLDIYMAEK